MEFCSTNLNLQVELPLHFTKELNSKQVRNVDHDTLLQLYFGKVFYLDNYVIFVTGKINGVKKILRMQILYYEKEPLVGRHIIKYGNGITCAVDSLTTFRKSFGFDDLFNFSRAAFIIDYENGLTLRLSQIKQFISLPHMFTNTYYIPPLYYPIRSTKVLVGANENIEVNFCDQLLNIMNDFTKVCPQYSISSITSCLVLKAFGSTVNDSSDPLDTNYEWSGDCFGYQQEEETVM